MTDLARLEEALRAADAAGDENAARQIAAEIRRQQSPVLSANERPVQGEWAPAVKALKNIGAEAMGGISDIDNLGWRGPLDQRMPAPLGAMIQAATGVNRPENRFTAPPLKGDPEFHNSTTGRAIRFAAPAALFPGQTLPMRAVSAATGAVTGAVDKAAEDAGLPNWQRLLLNMTPNVATGLLAGGAKYALRGAPSKGREMGENIATAERMGVDDFSVSQVAPEGNARLALIEKASSFGLGGQAPFQALAKRQSAQLKATAEKLAGGAADDAEAAGRTIWRGLFDRESGWITRVKGQEKKVWAPVDDALEKAMVKVPEKVPEGSNFWSPELHNALSRRGPLGEIERAGVKPTNYETALKEILGEFDSPNQAQAAQSDKIAARARLDALEKDGGVVSFNDFKRIRQEIGEANSGSALVPGERSLSQAQAGKLYAALMRDYEALAAQYGVSSEFKAAHSFSKSYHENSRNFFKSIFGKEAEPTKIIEEIATGNYQHPAKIRALRDALGPEEFKSLQEYTINRLGTPAGSRPGQFSLETFFTNYNNRFAGAGKSGNAVADAMFGPKGTAVRDGLETMFKFAEKSKEGSQLLYNTSGTAGSGLAGASLMAFWGDVAKRGGAMLAGGAAGAATVGGAPGIAGGIAAGAALTNLTARLFASPRFSRWMSKTAFESNARIPTALVTLSQTPMEDEETEAAKQQFIDSFKGWMQQ